MLSEALFAKSIQCIQYGDVLSSLPQANILTERPSVESLRCFAHGPGTNIKPSTTGIEVDLLRQYIRTCIFTCEGVNVYNDLYII